MKGSVRAWLPATLVAVVLGIGLGVALFSIRSGYTAKPIAIATLDPHSKQAVMAAVRHYYDVEAEARRTGNADLIDAVTTGHNSIASLNFHQFVADTAAQGRRSVTISNYFRDWSVNRGLDQASVKYVFWARGHDIDLRTGAPLEADMTTSKGSYQMRLDFTNYRWLVAERQLLQDNVQ